MRDGRETGRLAGVLDRWWGQKVRWFADCPGGPARWGNQRVSVLKVLCEAPASHTCGGLVHLRDSSTFAGWVSPLPAMNVPSTRNDRTDPPFIR